MQFHTEDTPLSVSFCTQPVVSQIHRNTRASMSWQLRKQIKIKWLKLLLFVPDAVAKRTEPPLWLALCGKETGPQWYLLVFVTPLPWWPWTTSWRCSGQVSHTAGSLSDRDQSRSRQKCAEIRLPFDSLILYPPSVSATSLMSLLPGWPSCYMRSDRQMPLY